MNDSGRIGYVTLQNLVEVGCMRAHLLNHVQLFATPVRLLCLWNSPGKNTGVGYHILQGIFPTQGLNLGLANCRQILHHLSYQTNCFCAAIETNTMDKDTPSLRLKLE